METNVKHIFYDKQGKILWTVNISNTSLSPMDPNQIYSGSWRPGDLYDGELFQWLFRSKIWMEK